MGLEERHTVVKHWGALEIRVVLSVPALTGIPPENQQSCRHSRSHVVFPGSVSNTATPQGAGRWGVLDWNRTQRKLSDSGYVTLDFGSHTEPQNITCGTQSPPRFHCGHFVMSALPHVQPSLSLCIHPSIHLNFWMHREVNCRHQ